MKNQSNFKNEVFNILTMSIPISDLLNHILGLGLFTLLMVLGAFIRIHLNFTPVPVTLQTLFMLLAGAFLGYGWGASAMGLYLLLGASGLPVFAEASCGIKYLFGPTGGYLTGFIIGAWIVGHMIGNSHNPSVQHILASFLLATIAVYVLGVSQLMLWVGCDLPKALLMGFIPFIPGDIFKIIIATAITKSRKK